MDASFLGQLLDWSTRPWFRLGNTDITLLRVVGLVVILFFSGGLPRCSNVRCGRWRVSASWSSSPSRRFTR
jgi:hypothetical protein